jgi:hypothetical protein
MAACENRDPEEEERPLLEAITKQREWRHKFLCDIDLWSVVMNYELKCSINPITNPNPVYSHNHVTIVLIPICRLTYMLEPTSLYLLFK